MFISEHLRTHLHCDSPQESALWTFNHQAQNHNCCIPVARSPQTLSTWLSIALPGCLLLLNCNNPNLLSNDSSVLSKNCIKPGFSNSHLLKIPCTQATGKPESTLATQTFVASFLTHGEDLTTSSHHLQQVIPWRRVVYPSGISLSSWQLMSILVRYLLALYYPHIIHYYRPAMKGLNPNP